MVTEEKVRVMKWYEDPVYIKMCEKAEEIQRLVQDWDYGYDIETDEVGVRVASEWQELLGKEYGVGVLSDDYYESWVWLPRQDQLQGMMDWSCWQLTARFAEFVHIEAGQIPLRFSSMEQLWLAFYMKEKHNKTWSGEEWVKS